MCLYNKRQRLPKATKMNNSEKLATMGTQDTRRLQSIQNTTQYVLNTTIRRKHK